MPIDIVRKMWEGGRDRQTGIYEVPASFQRAKFVLPSKFDWPKTLGR